MSYVLLTVVDSFAIRFLVIFNFGIVGFFVVVRSLNGLVGDIL